MTKSITEKIKRRYDRISTCFDFMEKMMDPTLRKRAVSLARGKVLEIGVGTGRNLEFYPPDCEVTAIDFSPGMLRFAREKAKKASVPVTILEMDAQNLDFPAQSFDTVLATCVFCSVPDPVQGLQEARRVCKPGGQIILLEHVRSENPIMGFLMDLLNPVTVTLMGPNINRRTVENVRKAEISIEHLESSSADIMKFIIGHP